jgi:DNA-directed RNA polymerase subunit RPC12/RpoP
MESSSDETDVVRRDVACPGCGYVPTQFDRWVCAPDGCGRLWDTFETGARCPDCGAQFIWTVCPGCNRTFPHKSWYRR